MTPRKDEAEMKHFRAFALVALFAVACADETVAPSDDHGDVKESAAAMVPPAACSKTWAAAVGGFWAGPSNWSPAGVPGPGDIVCITAPGTYEITALQQIEIGVLYIGGSGVAASLEFDAPFGLGIIADDLIIVEPGSAINVHSEGEARLSTGVLHNEGTVSIVNSCACGGDVALIDFYVIFNYGRMELDAPMTIMGDVWYNIAPGVVVTDGTGVIAYESGGGLFQWGGLIQVGTIVGSTVIETDLVDWYGGTIGDSGPAQSVVRVTGGALALGADPASPPPSGRIDAVSADSAFRVLGEVAPGMTVEIMVLQDDTLVFEGTTTEPFINEGTLSVGLNGQVVVETEHFVNEGLLELQGTGSLELIADEFVNRGDITDWGSDIAVTGVGSVLRNHGSITSAPNAVTLTMRTGTELVSYAGSDVGGSNDSLTVVLERGVLRGVGRFGDVVSIGGTVVPGLPAGTLIARNLTLDGTSDFMLQAPFAPAGPYGHLLVDEQVTYGGVFRMISIPGRPAGSCGDVLTPIRHPAGPAIGSFNAFSLPSRPGTGWRPVRTADSLILAGYDPSAPRLSVTRASIALEEGGVQKRYQVCLGPTVPQADVTLTPTSATGDVLVPAPIVFDRQTWMLPKSVVVEAWDDDIVEGVHNDTVSHTLASANPLYNASGVRPITVTIADNNGNADLELTVDTSPAAVTSGATIEIVYRITDLGPTLSTGSVLTIETGGTAGTTFLGATGAACVADTPQTVTCDVAGMLRDESLAVTVTWTATGAGNATFDAVVAGEQPDPVTGNDAVDTNVIVN
jgi:hypothetical protein